MKFLCPSCHAKYQIGDEKIAGRSVRMKCRICGVVFRIVGPSASEQEPKPRVLSEPSVQSHPASGDGDAPPSLPDPFPLQPADTGLGEPAAASGSGAAPGNRDAKDGALENRTWLRTTIRVGETEHRPARVPPGQIVVLSGKGLTSFPHIDDPEQVRSLDLSNNTIASIPLGIWRFSNLESLKLTNNRFTTVPVDLAELPRLVRLFMSDNRITVVPETIKAFKSLRTLSLSHNQLKSLPRELGELTNLRELYLQHNQLEVLPPEIGRLVKLHWLSLAHNVLTELPDTVCELAELRELDVYNNRLTDLPTSLEKLGKLEKLRIQENPLTLPPSLHEASAEQIVGFLSRRARGKQRYQAKLILLGHGKEGKTCLSRALRGLPFAHQNTTQGVNVDKWTFENPMAPEDAEKRITLSLWDFEGQEITHQSHQFFLTKRTLYIVVFSARDPILSRIEYWLDTIRARAPGCRALLVGTQSEDRTPQFDWEDLAARYPETLAERPYYAVDSETGLGIAELGARIRELSTHLDLVPQRWPPEYELLEEAIGAMAEKRAHLSRSQFNEILDECAIRSEHVEVVSDVLGDLGVITHFPQREELRDFIVLQPQWLTRALSLVLESRDLKENRGEISKSLIRRLWEREYPGMFLQFYNCMKQFELCYELEQQPESILVPLRFSNGAVPVKWLKGESIKERRVEYRFDLRPPAGLMSRFIVKTHHMICRSDSHGASAYWRNGVFLEAGSGTLKSQALGTWDEDRHIFRIVVRSVFPQTMLDQLDGFAQAVFAFFHGMTAERYYGCIADDGTPCPAFHEAKMIALSLEGDDHRILCAKGQHFVRPSHIITGLSSFARRPEIEEIVQRAMKRELEPLRRDLVTLGQGIAGLEGNLALLESNVDRLRLQGKSLPEDIGLRIEQMHGLLLSAFVAERHHQVPRIFVVAPKEQHALNPSTWFTKRYVIRLYCEHEQPHPGENATFEFTESHEWWRRVAPILGLVLRYVRLSMGPAAAAVPLALGKDEYELVEHGVNFAKSLTDVIPVLGVEDDTALPSVTPDPEREDEVLRARLAVAELIRKLDPIGLQAHAIGELKRYPTRDNSYRWLCARHAKDHGLS